ncbi:RNA recognition motif domain-containing protein [Candidatus Margulisiibacteriota bacterium]
MNIYVGNLPYSISEQDLKDLFGEYGAVTNVKIINDRETGRSKGFGFVEMAEKAEGDTAVKELNEKEMDGRKIKVNEARPREERPRARY